MNRFIIPKEYTAKNEIKNIQIPLSVILKHVAITTLTAIKSDPNASIPYGFSKIRCQDIIMLIFMFFFIALISYKLEELIFYNMN